VRSSAGWSTGAGQADRVAVPAWLGEIELTGVWEAVPDTGQRSSVLLVRLRGRPLGTLVLGPGGHEAAEVGARAIAAFGAPPPSAPPAAPAPPPSAPIEQPSVSVVVPTRGRPDMLLRCLDALTRQDLPAAEIVIVENGTDEPTLPPLLATALRSAPVPIRLLHRRIAGSAAARNLGVRHSTGAVVATTDDDAVPDPGWLAALVAALGRDAGVAAVTGLTCPLALRTDAQLWFEQYYGGFGKGFTGQDYRYDRRRPGDPFFPFLPGRMGAGNNLAVRRDALLAVGGYDPAFGPGSVLGNGEDIDLLFRLLQSGRTIRYEPGALVRHEHRADPAAFRRQIRGYGRGLTGFLTKAVLHRPAVAVELAGRLPAMTVAVLSGRTAVTSRPSGPTYPRSTRWLETLGMLTGPGGYLASRRDARRVLTDPALADSGREVEVRRTPRGA
jgi:GT2 family glycosyltransferase